MRLNKIYKMTTKWLSDYRETKTKLSAKRHELTTKRDNVRDAKCQQAHKLIKKRHKKTNRRDKMSSRRHKKRHHIVQCSCCCRSSEGIVDLRVHRLIICHLLTDYLNYLTPDIFWVLIQIINGSPVSKRSVFWFFRVINVGPSWHISDRCGLINPFVIMETPLKHERTADHMSGSRKWAWEEENVLEWDRREVGVWSEEAEVDEWMDEGFTVASEKLLQVRERADEMDVWNTPHDLLGSSAALKGLIPRKKSNNVKIQEEEGVKAQVMEDSSGCSVEVWDLRPATAVQRTVWNESDVQT